MKKKTILEEKEISEIVQNISKEIVEAILNRADIKADYVMYPWARALMMANTTGNFLWHIL